MIPCVTHDLLLRRISFRGDLPPPRAELEVKVASHSLGPALSPTALLCPSWNVAECRALHSTHSWQCPTDTKYSQDLWKNTVRRTHRETPGQPCGCECGTLHMAQSAAQEPRRAPAWVGSTAGRLEKAEGQTEPPKGHTELWCKSLPAHKHGSISTKPVQRRSIASCGEKMR